MNSLENETPRNLGFYWNATHFDRSSMTIQCFFEESVYISSQREFDSMQIKFIDTSLFFDFAGQYFEPFTTITKAVPPQF